MKLECDVCGMVFIKEDPDLDLRLIRHTQFHDPRFKGKSREHNGEFTVYKTPRNTVFKRPKYNEIL